MYMMRGVVVSGLVVLPASRIIWSFAHHLQDTEYDDGIWCERRKKGRCVLLWCDGGQLIVPPCSRHNFSRSSRGFVTPSRSQHHERFSRRRISIRDSCGYDSPNYGVSRHESASSVVRYVEAITSYTRQGLYKIHLLGAHEVEYYVSKPVFSCSEKRGPTTPRNLQRYDPKATYQA